MTWTFVAFLGTVSLLSIGKPQKTFSESENRYLQKRPKFTVSSLADGSFGEKYEKYLSDQFPGRETWVAVKVAAERLAGKEDSNGVYFGKDGYLIEKFDTEKIEGEQLEKNLRVLADFTKKSVEMLGEERVRVMLVPSASQIMKDKLPALASPYNQDRVTEMLIEEIAGKPVEPAGKPESPAELYGGIEGIIAGPAGGPDGLIAESLANIIVPVSDALREHSGEALYYQTDHHWTIAGAFLGYQAWAQSMGIKPWKPEDFKVRTVTTEFHGTVHSKVNIPWNFDSIDIWEPKEPVDYGVTFDEEPKEYHSLYFYNALEGKDKYSVFLDGNHAITKIENRGMSGEGRERKLLIIKDSYAHSFAVFAANHYGTVYMADLRYLNVDMETWMEEQGITDLLVLYQIPGFSKEKSVMKLK